MQPCFTQQGYSHSNLLPEKSPGPCRRDILLLAAVADEVPATFHFLQKEIFVRLFSQLPFHSRSFTLIYSLLHCSRPQFFPLNFSLRPEKCKHGKYMLGELTTWIFCLLSMDGND